MGNVILRCGLGLLVVIDSRLSGPPPINNLELFPTKRNIEMTNKDMRINEYGVNIRHLRVGL